MNRRLTDKRGMTLVEMLVAIAMASILIVFFFQADVALRKSAYGWIKQASLEETAILLRQQLGKDVLLIDSVLQLDGKELRFSNNRQQIICYRFDNRTITRNGTLILPTSVRLGEIDVSRAAGSTSLELTLNQGSERKCRVTLPIRPWKQRTLERSDI